MYYAYILGGAAILAQASFTNTINLGAVIVAIMIVVGFAWASRKDRRTERWESLYNLADTERKEMQAKLEEAMAMLNEQRGVIAKLDALQMPVKIVELMNSSVVRIDEAARLRLDSAITEVKRLNTNHELSAEERNKLLLDKLQEIVDRLPPIIHGGL